VEGDRRLMADDDRLPIRSYRLCFELERRIHKIDRWRIPVPYGVPLRGLAYGAAALAAVLVAGSLPLVGALLGVLHPAFRFVVLPVAAGYLLCRLRVDGRPAHAAGVAWLRHRLGPARVAGCRAAPALGPMRLGDVPVAPDERGCRYRPALVRGPASLLLRYPAAGRSRGRTLELSQRAGGPMWRGKRLLLSPGQRVRLR
jgi:hypothetical protein